MIPCPNSLSFFPFLRARCTYSCIEQMTDIFFHANDAGLSRYTSDEGLKNAFEQFGKLVESNEIAALYLAKFLLPSRRFTVPSYLFKASMC